MTIEQKAQRYNEALKRAKKLYEQGTITESLNYVFPELKEESEDERIRKELLNAFKESEDSLYMVLTPHRRELFIAWLEKQGNLMKALQISNARIGELIEKNYYLKEQLEKQDEHDMGISEATKQELENNLNNALEKETTESCNEFLEKQGEQEKSTKEKLVALSDGKQHLGWLDDADKVIESEQKPDYCHHEVDLSGCSEEYCKAYYDGWNNCNQQHAQLEAEQKPNWSEEDEKMLDGIIEASIHHCYLNITDINWLKSLKERFTWKPSDEQVEALVSAIDVMIDNRGAGDKNTILLSGLYHELKTL